MENSVKDKNTRKNVAEFESLYRNEYVMKSSSNLPTLVEQKDLNLSHIGSSLSTGTNLQQLNIASIDAIHHIPYVFIPKKSIVEVSLLKEYINKSICEKILQGFARICREVGDQFKILVLNRATLSNLKTVESLSPIVDSLLTYENFQEKFKKFKIFTMNGRMTKDIIMYLKDLMSKNQPLDDLMNIEKINEIQLEIPN